MDVDAVGVAAGLVVAGVPFDGVGFDGEAALAVVGAALAWVDD